MMTVRDRRSASSMRIASLALALVVPAAPALAQQAFFSGLFDLPAPSPSSSARQQQDEDADRDKATADAARTPFPGTKLLPVPADAGQALDLSTGSLMERPADVGRSIQMLHEPSPSVGTRLGMNVTRSASGIRLGGGYDTPSPEAITYDPRDLFDYKVQTLSDPRRP